MQAHLNSWRSPCKPGFFRPSLRSEAASLRQRELLESAQRAWQEYRDANCELISERDRADLKADALATCLDFMDRERQFELGLIGRLVRPD